MLPAHFTILSFGILLAGYRYSRDCDLLLHNRIHTPREVKLHRPPHLSAVYFSSHHSSKSANVIEMIAHELGKSLIGKLFRYRLNALIDVCLSVLSIKDRSFFHIDIEALLTILGQLYIVTDLPLQTHISY